jgi:hypothetical protein
MQIRVLLSAPNGLEAIKGRDWLSPSWAMYLRPLSPTKKVWILNRAMLRSQTHYKRQNQD